MTARELATLLMQFKDLDQEVEVAVESEFDSEFVKIEYVCDWYGDNVPRKVCTKEDI